MNVNTSGLKRHLRRLLREERLVKKAGKKRARGSSESFASALPTNTELESAIALFLACNRDSRVRLGMLRSLYHSKLVSLAAPVGAWDPYDIKPQVFALDTSLALPVFTSREYLQLFCSQFRLSVRSPSGDLWADWRLTRPVLLTETGQDQRQGAEDRARACAHSETEASPSTEEHSDQGAQSRRSEDARSEAHRAGATEERSTRSEEPPSSTSDNRQAERNAFWERVRGVKTFAISKATPLQTYGPVNKPYLYGYFSELDTLLHNMNGVVPDKVDVVINPASPLEFVVARDVTNAILGRNQLLHAAHQAVERDLQAEFALFFERCCPEVLSARSVTMPHLHPEASTKHADTLYDIVFVVESLAFGTTLARIAEAKARTVLIGHSTLQLLPLDPSVPKHYLEGGREFYAASSNIPARGGSKHAQIADGLAADWEGGGSGMIPMAGGASVAIRTDINVSNYFNDPDLSYTEAHVAHRSNHSST